METDCGVGIIYHHINLPGVFTDHNFHQKQGRLGFGDLEMVFDGYGHIQRPSGFRLAGLRQRLLHRKKLHAEREGLVLHLRSQKEHQKLLVVSPCSVLVLDTSFLRCSEERPQDP